MKFLKWVGSIFSIVVSGMYGGQKKKSVRRYGIPFISSLTGIIKDGFDWRDLTFLLWIPLLSMGYGENSMLMGLLGDDWIVRIVYGILLSIPFFFFGWKKGFLSAILLAGAFSIKAGSLGHLSWFGDLLIEDIIRYSVLGGLLIFNLFWRD